MKLNRYICNMFKRYKDSNWEFSENSTARYNGIIKPIKETVYISGDMLNVKDIIKTLFGSTPDKTTVLVDKPKNVWVNGNKGVKKSDATKLKMSLAKVIPFEFKGIKYKSVTEASKVLKVAKTTLYRHKKTLLN